MLENYLPSKKILSLLVLTVAGIAILFLFKDTPRQFRAGGSLSVVDSEVSVVEDVDRILLSTANRTDASFEEIAESVLLVTLGKRSSDGSNGFFPDEDAIYEFTNSVVAKLTYNNKDYTAKDLKTTRNSKENYAKYLNDLLKTSIAFAEKMTKDELDILSRAIDSGDENVLSELNPIIDSYKEFQKNLLAITVIRDLESEHLEIINNYSDIILSVGDMRKFFYDPVSTLVGVETYREANTRNDELFYQIGDYINNY